MHAEMPMQMRVPVRLRVRLPVRLRVPVRVPVPVRARDAVKDARPELRCAGLHQLGLHVGDETPASRQDRAGHYSYRRALRARVWPNLRLGRS